MKKNLLTISQAAAYLGVSIMTLRRWDKNGKLMAIRKEGGTHRYYLKNDLLQHSTDLYKLAHSWAYSNSAIPSEFYCPYSPTFQSRLISMQELLINNPSTNKNFSLIVAIAGEIGNNSYDHNLGNWPDVSGIFFGYNTDKKIIVLADRGLGILATLQKVKPGLANHQDAVRTAFTEIISGRAPEERGNGLKFVRDVIAHNPIDLFFYTGDAQLRMQGGKKDLHISRSAYPIRGCLVLISY